MEGLNLYAKLEGQNPVGSIKDRPAMWVLRRAAERGELHEDSTIVESSSGNFASALASYSRLLGLKFIPVIDPNITPAYESFLQRTCERVVKVTERDDMGGFLKTRLQKVQELCASIPGAYWPNQYGNPDVIEAHYQLTGEEIRKAFTQLDYVFIGVSTGGTIAGVSHRLKEAFPSVRVVAVDAQGSVIFGGAAGKRYIPGIGASVRPQLVDHALIDDVVLVPEIETVQACRELLQEHGLLVGGSSGSCYAAVKRYLPRFRASATSPTVLFLCADRGTAYLETIFTPSWATRFA
ncbi:2,3-diaminopropionate biosynthesis protein SbnA [Archangium minus]|uniref:2,3-diaminopropionate biosynthesis protein SbnA n=2 Tax=Archangium minus TaxID=83450 RepID=A0ABY9XB48_9BACT|nr:2,3-diaminopropionate biosynthesis protein SbnA [Archangium minus]